MMRIIASTVALTGIAGFTVGWLTFGPQGSPGIPSREEPASALAEKTHTFPLLPADMHCDRETPAVAVDAAGRIVLAWASQTAELERTLWLARSVDGGATFERPVAFRKVPIHRQVRTYNGKERVFTTNVLPRLATHQSILYLGWVEAVNGGPRVDFLLAQSQDGGQTFAEPVTVHSEAAARPGYTALSVNPAGAVVCAWLEGRNKLQQPFSSVSSGAGQPFLSEQLVYRGADGKGICPCCDLAAACAADGTAFVAFRNAESGYRDIWLARSGPAADGNFAAALPVTKDSWRFDGCPHDGPALALTGDQLHVAWMDAHTGKRRVYYAHAPVTSLNFTPRELNTQALGEEGHPKIAASSEGLLHVVWDSSLQEESAKSTTPEGHQHGLSLQGSDRAIMYTFSTDGGNNFAPPQAIAARSGMFQYQPAIAINAAGVVYVAWNEMSTEGKNVVFARLAPYVSPCCK